MKKLFPIFGNGNGRPVFPGIVRNGNFCSSLDDHHHHPHHHHCSSTIQPLSICTWQKSLGGVATTTPHHSPPSFCHHITIIVSSMQAFCVSPNRLHSFLFVLSLPAVCQYEVCSLPSASFSSSHLSIYYLSTFGLSVGPPPKKYCFSKSMQQNT